MYTLNALYQIKQYSQRYVRRATSAAVAIYALSNSRLLSSLVPRPAGGMLGSSTPPVKQGIQLSFPTESERSEHAAESLQRNCLTLAPPYAAVNLRTRRESGALPPGWLRPKDTSE